MSAIDDFATLLETTEVMKQVLKSLKEEPAAPRISEYQQSGELVPDHRLHFFGYLGEASLRVLLSVGLIRRYPGGRLSLYSYEPTAEGLEQYERLKADGVAGCTG